MNVPATLFERIDDTAYRATEATRGPWDPNALHGGPAGLLAAGALEQAIATAVPEVGFFPARIGIDLLRPVPLDVLTVETTITRPGRKVCVAEATVRGPDGTICLAARLGAIRRRTFDGPVDDALPAPPPPAKGLRAEMSLGADVVSFARHGVEHRVVAGSFEGRGPATDWIRVVVNVVDDRPPTPLERVLAAADFGNGVSKWFDMSEVLFVNPDLSVNLHRLPVGEWVCLDAVTRIGPDGVGLAESMLWDEDGPLGRATQSLLVERR